MPEFATPEPVSVTIDAVSANVTIVANDRANTVVDIRPTRENDESDLRAAAAVQVDYAVGRLLVRGPRRSRLFSTRSESFDVRIDLPTESNVDGQLTLGGCTTEGRLGACRFKTYDGGLSLDRTGPLRLSTGQGRIGVRHAAGRVEISTGSGEVFLGRVDGPAEVKTLNGQIRIGTIDGDLRVKSTNAEVSVDHAGSVVRVTSVSGNIQVNDVVRGVVELDVTAGDLEVGIRKGSTAWLDVHTVTGRLLNSMTATEGPGTGETVEVRARTYTGDIVVRRS